VTSTRTTLLLTDRRRRHDMMHNATILTRLEVL
jgi:hypothetical protein